MNKSSSESLQQFLATCKTRVESHLQGCLQNSAARQSELLRAMEYATLKGGKRIRPVLAYGAVLAVGGKIEHADDAACALELMHCYSLVHDDLPAMDNDDLRRGNPTVHKAFNETTAILAGDALQSLAFQLLAESHGIHTPAALLRMLGLLARAAGYAGMAGGQSLDFEAVGKTPDLAALETMHSLKTGKLITASVQLGGLCHPGIRETQFTALTAYGQYIGLAFQVQDDILDVTADTETLGKPQGADVLMNKPTYASLLGLEKARQKASELAAQAIAALDDLPETANLLRQLAHYIVQRAH